MPLQTPRQAFLQVAVVKNKQKGNAHDAVFGSQVLVGIDVQFADPYFAFGFDPELVDNRCIGTAARSPWRPGEYEYRQGGLQHLIIKIGFGDHDRLGGKQFFGVER